MSEALVRAVVWNGGELSLMESSALWQGDAGFALEGTVVGALDRTGFSAHYRVECSADWRTRSVRVRLTRPPHVREVDIEVDADARWLVHGVERPDLQGLLDVDIQVTPATNTLPIRRLALSIGQSSVVTAAWVRFPDLDVIRLAQSYTRVAERRYVYASGSFTAELEVDDDGVVERYGSFWRRVPTE